MENGNIPPDSNQEENNSQILLNYLEKAPDPFVAINPDDSIKYVNLAYQQLTGFSTGEVLGKKPPFPHWPPEFQRKYTADYIESFQKRDNKLFLKKNGESFWVEIDSIPLMARKKILFYLCHWTDITQHKLADDRLRQSEEKYRLLVENASEAIIVVQDGVLKYLNPATLAVTGFKAEEMLFQSFERFIHPDDLETVKRNYSRRLKGETPIPVYEFRAKARDGSYIWFEASGATITWEGKPATLNLLNDITERKLAQDKLKQSEALFRLLAENAKDLIFRLRLWPDVKLEYISPSVLAFTGYSPEEHYADPGILYQMRHLVDGGSFKADDITRYTYKAREMRWTKRDGSVIWAEEQLHPLYNDSGKLTGMEGIVRDITERKRAEAARADETTRRRILVDQSRDGIVVLDLSGRVYEANRRFTEMLGYSREEIMQLHVWEWESRITQEKVINMLESVDEKGDHFETIHRRKDGTFYDVEISSNGAVYAGQKLIFCVCRDITERKRMEETVKGLYEMEKKQRLELQEEARARGLFIDVLAHELRTPLTPILASTSMLRDLLEKGQDKTLKRLTENVHISAQALAGRLEELLEVARYSRGTFKLSKKPVNVYKFLRGVIERFEPTLESKKQHLFLDVPDRLPEIQIDQSRIEQVLINLLSNASKFAPASDISLEVAAGPENLVFSVIDKGIGISAEDQSKIFQPYHRVEQDRQKFPGIGLGLAVCRQIIEAHGGQIGVTSEPGKGSTFTFSLPINQP